MGSLGHIFKQLLVAILALTLGKLIGQLLHLQNLSNALGRSARERIAAARPGDPQRANAGFKVCATLFCAAPLGWLGSLQDGLSGYAYPLAIKAVIDGLATLGFVPVFGRGVLLSALPVLAFQGTLSLLSALVLRPILEPRGLVDPVNAVGGLLVFCVALVILGLKKIKLADYLPSLAVAPLLAWWWR